MAKAICPAASQGIHAVDVGAYGKAHPGSSQFKLAIHRCAEWFGGRPEQYRPLVHAMVSLIHGHAMLKISGYEPWTTVEESQAALDKALDILAANQDKFRN